MRKGRRPLCRQTNLHGNGLISSFQMKVQGQTGKWPARSGRSRRLTAYTIEVRYPLRMATGFEEMEPFSRSTRQVLASMQTMPNDHSLYKKKNYSRSFLT